MTNDLGPTRDGLIPVDEALALVSQSLQTTPALPQAGLGADQVLPGDERDERIGQKYIEFNETNLKFSPTIF